LMYFFSYNYPVTSMFYPLSLHDALPIYIAQVPSGLLQRDPSESKPLRLHIAPFVAVDRSSKLWPPMRRRRRNFPSASSRQQSGKDRKSTRLNSSHLGISYAVFCLKKKKK